MSIYTQSRPSLNARMIKILWRQQQELLKKSPDHVTPIINDEDPIDIQADIEGPEGTPYECGIFRVRLFIPNEFPQIAPKGFFVTKIFHPNVSEKGEICVNTLKRDWNPKQWSLYNLFEVIKCLLIVPFPQSSLNEEAGKMFMDNYDEYFRVAKMLTDIHAKKKTVQKDNDEGNKEKSDKLQNKDNNEDISDNTSNNRFENKDNNLENKIIEGKKSEENCDNDIEGEDVEMKINNFSEKKIGKNKSAKKEENIDNEIEISEEKDKMNISFLNEFSNGEINNNSYWNNNINNNNKIFNFDNGNIFEDVAITRSKTIKYCDRMKFNFFNSHSESVSQIFHNGINKFSRMSSISSINSSGTNISTGYDFKKVSTFKEKPKLGSLPLMHMNSSKIKNSNKNFGFFRCKTLNLSKNETKKNNKDEINKWLMRI